MSIKITKFNFILLVAFLLCSNLKSQNNTDTTKTKIKLNISTDIVSRYIWRGSDYGNSPAIQPSLSLSVKNIEIGCWGSAATNSNYTEIDLYAKYTYKNFGLSFTDYYVPTLNGLPTSPDTRYFAYTDKKTAHCFEAAVSYKGGEKFPLWLMGGVYFYGNDKRWGYDVQKDISEKTYYSSYIEAGYSFAVQQNNIDFVLGITPTAGAYGKKFGIINLGISGSRKIKITESFEIPIKTSLIFNPQASTAFFVFGITL